MSTSLYNPFMVNLDFTNRMARGGGGGGSPKPSKSAPDPIKKYDVPDTAWAGKVKKLFLTPSAIPKDTSGWKVTGGRNNYKLEFKDGTAIPLTLGKYDDEKPRIQKLVNNLDKARNVATKQAAQAEAKRKAEAAKKAAAAAAAKRKEAERRKKAKQMAVQAAAEREAARRESIDAKLEYNRQAEADEMSDIEASGSNAVERRLQQNAPKAPAAPATQAAAGTMTSPLASARESAIPEAFTYRPDYTGTTMRNLTSASQQGTQQLIENVMYSNELGQTVGVTEVNGEPTTYVPPGFTRIDQAKVLFDQDY